MLEHILTGFHPVVALIIVLLVGPPALLSKSAAHLPGVLGATGRWWQRREPATASYRISQTEIERISEAYDRVVEDYKGLVAHNAEQDARMDALEKDLTEEKRRFWEAIGYIRRLIDALRRHDPDAEIPAIPEMLRDIL